MNGRLRRASGPPADPASRVRVSTIHSGQRTFGRVPLRTERKSGLGYPAVGLTNRGWYRAAVNRWLVDMRGIVEITEGRERIQFALLCLREFRRRRPDGRAIILVPTLYALDVWSVVLGDYEAPGEVACISGDERATRLRRVNLVTISSMRQLVAFTSKRAQTLLVVDECQRAQGLWAGGILSGSFGAALGLASKPIGGRSPLAKPAVARLGPVLWRKTQTERGRGSSLELINVKVDLPLAERARYALLTSRAAAFQRAHRPELEARNAKRRMRLLSIRSALSAAARVRLQVAAKIVDQHRGDRTFVLLDFAGSAEALGELLRGRHHGVCLWHSGLSPTTRRTNLGRFHHGAADVLIVCRGTGGLTYFSPSTVGVVVTPGRDVGIAVDALRHALGGRRDHRAVLYALFTSDDERSRLDRAARTFPRTRVFWRAGTP